MKLEIKSIPKALAGVYLLNSAFLIFLIFFTFYYQGYLLMLICIAILLLGGGYFLYAYTTSANFLIDEQGIHILRGRKEKNFLPWNLVKTIGYQRGHIRRRFADFLYVSLVNGTRTKQIIDTAKTNGISSSDVPALNKDALRTPLDFSRAQEKILILNSQTSTNEFDQLCRIQLAYAHQTGGEIAETYVNLEATEIDAGN